MPPPKGKESETAGKDKDAKALQGKDDKKPEAKKDPLTINDILLSPLVKNIAIGLAATMAATTLVVFLLYQLQVDRTSQVVGVVSTMRGILSYGNDSYARLDDLQILSETEKLLSILMEIENKSADVEIKVNRIIELLDKGWQAFSGHLYYFSDGPTQKQERAAKICIYDDSYLVSVKSTNEEKFLEKVAKEKKLRYWIGLSMVRGEWKWINGEKLSSSGVSFWAHGHPKTKGDVPGICAEIQGCGESMKCWYEVPCAETRNWICKLDPDPELMAEDP